MKITIIVLFLFAYALQANDYYYKNNKKIPLTFKKLLSRTSQNVDYYVESSGIEFGITNMLIVKLKDENILNDYLSEFNLSLEKKLGVKVYLLKTRSKGLTLEISNSLNEKTNVIYSHPDFIKKRIKR